MKILLALTVCFLLSSSVAQGAIGNLPADVSASQQMWEKKGITGCETGISSRIVDNFSDDTEHGYPPNGIGVSCSIELRAIPVWDNGVPLKGGWDNACGLYYEFVVEHEVGHALGLEHDDPRFPVMSSQSPEFMCADGRDGGSPDPYVRKHKRSRNRIHKHVKVRFGRISGRMDTGIAASQ